MYRIEEDKMKWVLIRHGETDENVNEVFQGNHGTLNSNGFKQVQELIKKLKKEKFDLIISSDLLRCKLTAEKISEKFKVPIIYTDIIREKKQW